LLALVANGKFPFYFGFSAEVVGIEDAARAMLLAAEHGRIGERYIISDRYMSIRELHEIAATAVGRRPPRIGIPMAVLRAGARVNDVLARLLGRDLPFASAGMRMAELMSPLDHSKAERELGWTPEPVEDSIREAAVFFASQR
ncbi:MAG: NAD-dependent epimerase/dehydratase family protein, partial [Mycobacterium sp.]